MNTRFETREPSATEDSLARAVIGAAIDVHRELGPGFLEALYAEAMAIELQARGVAFAREVAVAIRYKDKLLQPVRLDLLVEGALVVELKSVERLLPLHTAQALTYLRAANATLGLLINFNVPLLKEGVRRIIDSRRTR